jgi:hypothetical protein
VLTPWFLIEAYGKLLDVLLHILDACTQKGYQGRVKPLYAIGGESQHDIDLHYIGSVYHAKINEDCLNCIITAITIFRIYRNIQKIQYGD